MQNAINKPARQPKQGKHSKTRTKENQNNEEELRHTGPGRQRRLKLFLLIKTRDSTPRSPFSSAYRSPPAQKDTAGLPKHEASSDGGETLPAAPSLRIKGSASPRLFLVCSLSDAGQVH